MVVVKIKVYFKYGCEIYVVVKNGGLDLFVNLVLCGLLDWVKKDQVLFYVIDKVIDKVQGGSGEDFLFVFYEGIGLGGCMVLISVFIDNGN